ncbi:MAG: fumarylacetoacetate hydrolase family protein [Alphaproteobacteria bacterium]
MAQILFRPPVATLPIQGSDDQFAVRNMWFFGLNYRDHAVSIGVDPDSVSPFMFGKPHSTLAPDGVVLPMPTNTIMLNYEIELVIAIGKGGKDIAEEDARGHVFGFAAGIDLTKADLLGKQREKGLPWTIAKAFDQSSPLAAIRPIADIDGEIDTARIWLEVNGETRQDSTIDDMLAPINKMIAFASSHAELKPGDLIWTGTPAGVAPLQIGDKVTGGIAGVGDVSMTVA